MTCDSVWALSKMREMATRPAMIMAAVIIMSKLLYKNEENAVLIITHNTRILQNLKVDYVHILVDGKIVKTGSSELAEEIEKEGYGKYKNEN